MRTRFLRADIRRFDYEAYFLRQVYLDMGCCWDGDATANRSVTLRGESMMMVALYKMILRDTSRVPRPTILHVQSQTASTPSTPVRPL